MLVTLTKNEKKLLVYFENNHVLYANIDCGKEIKKEMV